MPSTPTRIAIALCLAVAGLTVATVHAAPNGDDGKRTFNTSAGIDLPPAALRSAPGFCLIEFGGVSGYLSSCIRTHALRPNLLPRDCVVRVSEGNRTRRPL